MQHHDHWLLSWAEVDMGGIHHSSRTALGFWHARVLETQPDLPILLHTYQGVAQGCHIGGELGTLCSICCGCCQ